MKKHVTVLLFLAAVVAMLVIPTMAIDDYTGYFSEAELLAMSEDEKAEFLRVHRRPGGSILSVETLSDNTVVVTMQEADGTPGGVLYMPPPGSDDWMWEVSDDVLSGDTRSLLETFLNTTLVRSSTAFGAGNSSNDWVKMSVRPLVELVSRNDLLRVLDEYARDLFNSSDERALTIDILYLECLLKQPSIQKLVFDENVELADYPSLLSIYSNGAIPCALTGCIIYNGIIYCDSGTIDTVSGRKVTVSTAGSELSETQINQFIADGVTYNNTMISAPTSIYNCHSYAWYLYSTSNPYWIDDISQFLLDNVCVEVNTSAVQIKDIIVYYDENDTFQHSGVVYGFDASGNILIQSKWGQGAVYRHVVDNVPLNYKSNGDINVKYYRYHDYANRYTGSEYHSGSYHYYQYADFCTICNKQINTTWISVECSGPPCPTPWSLIDRRRVYAL